MRNHTRLNKYLCLFFIFCEWQTAVTYKGRNILAVAFHSLAEDQIGQPSPLPKRWSLNANARGDPSLGGKGSESQLKTLASVARTKIKYVERTLAEQITLASGQRPLGNTCGYSCGFIANI